ncbi:response regulator [Hydrogenophaga sp.]|uniref:response regulator n=2 Tax=Hydrogenophaga sp. TaxID=1904254 RepID=UPI0027327653|nr:response regulator [Hydrogenophaga sp.]MDP1781247.1 response regulator [Hydrogenophaga sp.]MDP2985422.1 response regulator [Hydrogenophaga sp.]
MSCRVLMVDDNENDLLFTRIALQRSGVDFEIHGFERAQEALKMLAGTPEHGIDLILLDINMPVMDGFGFLQAFDALPASQRGHAVVVMLSSSSDPADRARASAHPSVKGFLNKPLSKTAAADLIGLVQKR